MMYSFGSTGRAGAAVVEPAFSVPALLGLEAFFFVRWGTNASCPKDTEPINKISPNAAPLFNLLMISFLYRLPKFSMRTPPNQHHLACLKQNRQIQEDRQMLDVEKI